MLRSGLFSLGLVCLVLGAGCARQPSGPQEIKLSHILGESSPWYHGAQRWKALVEERLPGKYTVTIYNNASLSNRNQDTELGMTQTGVLQASIESTILLCQLEPKFSAWTLPGLLASHAVAHRVMDSSVGQQLLDLLPAKDLVGLAYGTNGFRQLTNNKRPVRTPTDLARLKIRVPGMRLLTDLYRHLGADPSPMNFGELIPALQEGAMDGQENPLSVVSAARLYTVQKHLTVWDLTFDPIILCVNRAWWEQQPAGDRTVLRQAAREAFTSERELVASDDQRLVDELRQQGMEITVLSPTERQMFREACAPVFDDYEPVIGQDLLAAIQSAANES